MNNLWYRLPFYLTLVSGKEWTGYPLECFNARVGALKNYQICGNSIQSGLPQGYTLLEYISNGYSDEPFINTNITANGNDIYEIDFMIKASTGNRAVFGGHIGTTFRARVLWLDPNGFYPQYGNNGYNTKPVVGTKPVADQRYQFKSSGPLSEINIYGDSQKYYSDYENTETFDGGRIIIFGLEGSGKRDPRTAFMSLYGFRITRDNTVIMNLVPCINPNNEIGMYDTVSKTFLGNAGTGDFIAGPIAQPETPVIPITPQYPALIESVGEKSENLYNQNEIRVNTWINTSGQFVTNNNAQTLVLPVQQGDTYYFTTHWEQQTGSNRFSCLAGYDENMEFVAGTRFSASNPNVDDLEILSFTVNNPSVKFLAFGTYVIKPDWYMIKKNDSSTEYVPEGYKIPVNVNDEITNIYLSEPLRKIGDVADYIDYENQKVVRWFKEETIKPSTEWGITSTGVWIQRSYFDTTVGGATSIICSHFKTVLGGNYPAALQDLTLARDYRVEFIQGLYIRYDALGFTTGEQITQWLAENKPTIVYQLETPIEESIELPEIRLPGACVITTDTKIKPSKMYGKQ